jgi:hypothetical protein
VPDDIAEELIDPDCVAGKCATCVGGPCTHICHTTQGSINRLLGLPLTGLP